MVTIPLSTAPLLAMSSNNLVTVTMVIASMITTAIHKVTCSHNNHTSDKDTNSTVEQTTFDALSKYRNYSDN